MGRYIEGQERTQSTLFPERLDDWIDEDNPVRAIDVFVELSAEGPVHDQQLPSHHALGA
jgi:hypothetical protein